MLLYFEYRAITCLFEGLPAHNTYLANATSCQCCYQGWYLFKFAMIDWLSCLQIYHVGTYLVLGKHKHMDLFNRLGK